MRSKFWIMAGVAAMIVAFSPTASATLQLTLSSGGNTIIINDNGANDSSGATGQIAFIGSIGTWTLNVTTGTVGTNPDIDLSSVNTGLGTGSGALTMTFSSTDYSDPFTAQFVSTIGGTLASGHSLTYNAYVNTNNALNGTTTAIGGPLSFSNPPPGFTGTTTGGFAPANTLYSLTQVVTLSGTKKGSTSFDANIEAVPEPATVALLGGVLVATFSTLRRKKNRA